jgi:hypothetical protein
MPFVAHQLDGKRGDDNNLWESDEIMIHAQDNNEQKNEFQLMEHPETY